MHLASHDSINVLKPPQLISSEPQIRIRRTENILELNIIKKSRYINKIGLRTINFKRIIISTIKYLIRGLNTKAFIKNQAPSGRIHLIINGN